MHLLEGKLALKIPVFGGQEDVSYLGHTKKNSSWKFVGEKNMTFCQQYHQVILQCVLLHRYPRDFDKTYNTEKDWSKIKQVHKAIMRS